MTSRNLLSAKQRAHNKSTLCLNQTPRPYLPQSASQVDFQLPLLPFHKMQEAIVSQRLLEPPQAGSLAPANSASGLADVVGSQVLQVHHASNETLACSNSAGGGGGAVAFDKEQPQRYPEDSSGLKKLDYSNLNADELLCAKPGDLATLRNIVGEPQRPQQVSLSL